MEEAKKLVEARIKYLKELIAITPIFKSFSAQFRLTEAEHILALLKDPKK